MARELVNCNSRLSPRQIRNPKLGPDRDGNAWVESAPWRVGETLKFAGFMAVGSAVGAEGVTVLGDLFYTGGGMGFGGGDSLSTTTYFLAGGLPAALMFAFVMWIQFLAPTIFKPVEFATSGMKEAHVKYHELPKEDQYELSTAYQAYMKSTEETRSEAATIWASSLVALEKIKVLETKQLEVEEVTFADPFLEEAQHGLNALNIRVRELENTSE